MSQDPPIGNAQPDNKPGAQRVCIGGFGKYTLGKSIGDGGAGVV